MQVVKRNFEKTKIKAKGWVERNERYLTVGFFTLGLIVDRLTLTRIDLLFDNLILLTYLSLAILGIVFLYKAQIKKKKNPQAKLVKISKYIPFLTQYAFGGLFSGYIIFYSKSATWTVSWFFLFIIIALFLGNERFRQNYKQVDFQISILFVAIFSFMIFLVPVVIKKMGAGIFILSGVLSIALISSFIYFLSKFISPLHKNRKKKMATHI